MVLYKLVYESVESQGMGPSIDFVEAEDLQGASRKGLSRLLQQYSRGNRLLDARIVSPRNERQELFRDGEQVFDPDEAVR